MIKAKEYISLMVYSQVESTMDDIILLQSYSLRGVGLNDGLRVGLNDRLRVGPNVGGLLVGLNDGLRVGWNEGF